MKGVLKIVTVVVILWAGILVIKQAYFILRYPVDFEQASEQINYLIEPIQESTISTPINIIDRTGRQVIISPVATYDIQARIIINRGYPHYDIDYSINDLLTNDLVLAWGRVAQDQYLKHIKFSHQFTYMTFRYNNESLTRDLGQRYISEHLSSNHLLGANQNIENALRRLNKDDVVRITGYLINIEFPGEDIIRSSLVRTDNWGKGQGNTGGSEFIYVTRIQKGTRVYK